MKNYLFIFIALFFSELSAQNERFHYSNPTIPKILTIRDQLYQWALHNVDTLSLRKTGAVSTTICGDKKFVDSLGSPYGRYKRNSELGCFSLEYLYSKTLKENFVHIDGQVILSETLQHLHITLYFDQNWQRDKSMRGVCEFNLDPVGKNDSWTPITEKSPQNEQEGFLLPALTDLLKLLGL